jgi:predicted ATPase/class 3 adenylate cyclase
LVRARGDTIGRLLRGRGAMRKIDTLRRRQRSIVPESHPSPMHVHAMAALLFTDIEGSTSLWERDSAQMSRALLAHDALVRDAVESHGGTVVKMTGDGLCAAFAAASNAVAATVSLQLALGDPSRTEGIALHVRSGLHIGVVERRDGDCFGTPVNRAARIMRAAHGGQILLSQAFFDCVRDDLAPALSVRDLGNVRLKDLSTPEHVYQLVHRQLRHEFPPLQSLESTPNNLPHQTTNFVGRESELADLKAMLTKVRLLTLTGSGGCGKTRLCLQASADLLEHFPDGVWLVELASLRNGDLVVRGVAQALGLTEQPHQTLARTIVEYAVSRRLLLILDNCEHLLVACAQLSDTLIRDCPNVTVFATSREALGIAGEHAFRVPSLALPKRKNSHSAISIAPYESVQLFNDRATLARADFRLTDQDAAALVSICHHLDGIPLAIELAAARVRMMSLKEIDERLNERFRLLTGGSKTALPRQQTLRSLIDWSYDLLQQSEKLMLQRLSVFAGGWTLSAAERVCVDESVPEGNVLDLLISLCDKSLVVVDQNGSRSRYSLLETVRQYARDRLFESGRSAIVRDRHRDEFLALAEAAESELVGRDQAEWLRRLEQEHENLRAALDWSIAAPDKTCGLRLCGALQQFWIARSYLSEGQEWCARMLENCGASCTAEKAKALNTAARLAYFHREFASARTLNEESLAVHRHLGDQRGIALTLSNMASLAFEEGDFATAQRLFDESIAIAREMDDPSSIAGWLNSIGNVAFVHGDMKAARVHYEESLGLMRRLGDRFGIAKGLNNLGNVDFVDGNLDSAQTRYEESLAIRRELENRAGIANSLNNLGSLAFERGDFERARGLHQESILIDIELGDRRGIAYSLEGIADVAAALGDSIRAAVLWGAAERLREGIRSPMTPDDRARHGPRIAQARAAVGDKAFNDAWHGGGELALDQAIEFAALNDPGNLENAVAGRAE